MPDLYADLHLHSAASDGTDLPAALPRVLTRARVGAAALTDHDTVEGLAPFLEGCRAAGVAATAGLEADAACATGHLHLLLLGFPPEDKGIASLALRLAGFRDVRNREILRRLALLGVELSWERVLAEARGRSVGRPHLVRALMATGAVRSRTEAWERYLGDRAPAGVAREKLPAGEIIAAGQAAGAVVIAAHPISAVGRAPDALVPFLETLREQGLDGAEAFHPSQPPEVAERVRAWTRERGLFCSGGSDHHGANRPAVTPGHLGRRRLPVEPLLPLLERLGL
ncbi:MAG: PHP domain-containing protein, partial [Deltaproteobacteria bacterium]|nr:PHP domain-containing protein [Deltaproteobacteria bacterium]